MKEMTSVATTVMTEEEKAQMERDLKGEGASPAVTSAEHHAAGPSGTATPLGDATSSPSETKEGEIDIKEAKRKRKLTPEQKEKLEALEKERAEARKKRVADLLAKLLDRYTSYHTIH